MPNLDILFFFSTPYAVIILLSILLVNYFCLFPTLILVFSLCLC
nr:MAG TPA: hypothetical protein [Caudoviricetes sp.]